MQSADVRLMTELYPSGSCRVGFSYVFVGASGFPLKTGAPRRRSAADHAVVCSGNHYWRSHAEIQACSDSIAHALSGLGLGLFHKFLSQSLHCHIIET